uniref:CSON000356 protein n=1 Tax=Culicoides sonorensis TaxID=179676 RepID=A0A336MGZ8_CULSO
MKRFSTKYLLHCTTLLLCLSFAVSERWSRQVPQHGFLAHQINDWIPVQSQFNAGADRSSRFAQFPSNSAFGVNSFASPAQAQYNPFTTSQRFGFNAPAPQAQPLLQQQQQQVLSPQQLQNVESGVAGQETPVELLYVPLETLQKQGFQGGNQNQYNVIPQNVNAALINNFYESGTVAPATKTRFSAPITTTTSRPVTERQNPFQSSPTVKSTLKPYQPPLAMFLLTEGRDRATVNDVLSVLKRANTIDVLDAPSEKRPNVFIGPSDMTPPAGYTKFDLPYLSHLDSQRNGRKIENLPFFVAPLSYHTPNGFGKIPLPAPHVGSVVVNTPLSNKQEVNQYFGQNQLIEPQSQKFGFNQDKFNNQAQFVSSTVKPQSVTNRFNANHFDGSHSTLSPRPSSTGRPVTTRPSPQVAFNDFREEHFNTNKQRKPVNQHPQQQPFSQFSTNSQPTRTRPTQQQYHEEVTTTPLPETHYSEYVEPTTTKKPATSHRKPTSAQTAQSSISYQTAPSRQPSSQFFEESFQTPSSTFAPSTNFFPGFAQQQNPFSDQQFVHKFKLVDSVKPNYKATKEPDFFSFNTNPFSFDNGYNTLKSFSPPPAPVQQTERQRYQSFPSSTLAPTTQKRPTQSSTFQFTPSSVRPVVEDASAELTSEEPVRSFSPTTTFHSTNIDSQININGQSPANIHQQNIETTKLAYDPYKVPSTEKTVPVRGGSNSNYRQQSSKAPSLTSDVPQNNAFQGRRPNYHFDTRQPVQQHHSSRPTNQRPSSTISQEQPSTYFSSEDFTSSIQTVRPRPSTTARPVSQSTRRPVEQSQRFVGNQGHNRGTRPTSIATDAYYQPEQQNYQQYQQRPQSVPSTQRPTPQPTTTTTLRPQEQSYEFTQAPEEPVENQNVHEVQKDHIQLTHISSQSISEVNDNVPTEVSNPSTDSPISYNTPSDLPSISPMLPGLINSLTDDKWMDGPKEEVTTTTTTTTRRPFIRGRRPIPSRDRETSTSTRVQSSEAASSTRSQPNTSTRARRPLTTRFNKTSTPESTSSSQTSSAIPSTRTQQSVRNNRVRYNPTPEERQRLRSRGRPQSSAKPVEKGDEKDIDYQRDVLNQNYPVIKPRVTQAPTTTTTGLPTTTTEIPTPETVQIQQEENLINPDESNEEIRVPVNHASNYRGGQEQGFPDPTRKYPGLFNGLQEEMILPQEHLTTLYEEQEIVTEPIFDQRKSVFKQKGRLNPIFSTVRPSSSRLTTTTDYPSVETTTSGRRRPTFPRRQSRPLSTTQQPAVTTESDNDEVTIKPVRRQPVRTGLRIRERRPLNDQTTVSPVNEVSSRRSYQSRGTPNVLEEEGVVNSRRQNFPSRNSAERELKREKNDPTNSVRGRQRSRFRLEQQETQWSVPSATTEKTIIENEIDEKEPEVVTDDSISLLEKENTPEISETNDLPAENPKPATFPRRRPEPVAVVVENEEKPEEKEDTELEKKPNVQRKGAKRRGYWKKVRVRPVDTFETAESQHIGNHYLNTLIPQNINKFNYDKATSISKTSEITKELNSTKTKTDEDKNQDVSIEVVNWSRDTMPKVSIMTTENPSVTEEVKELNKDDSVRNNSEEEVEKIAVTTLAPENNDHEQITTISPDTAHEVSTEDDSNMFDEVRKSLKDLFGMSDNEEDEETVNTTIVPLTEEIENEVTTIIPEVHIETTQASTLETESTTTEKQTPSDPMGSLVLATSTSRHISLETEICYRGRCIKTDKKLEKK